MGNGGRGGGSILIFSTSQPRGPHQGKKKERTKETTLNHKQKCNSPLTTHASTYCKRTDSLRQVKLMKRKQKSAVLNVRASHRPTTGNSAFLVVEVAQRIHVGYMYWAIQRSWFARVNAFCNLSRKKSREVAAHFRADF